MATHQTDDGIWRQLVDDPDSYREPTVTATTVTAMSRGIRLGWLDRDEFLPVVERGWQAIVARVAADGTVRDVCAYRSAVYQRVLSRAPDRERNRRPGRRTGAARGGRGGGAASYVGSRVR
jgi:rhamnogalacturonyl hydrolase YesR